MCLLESTFSNINTKLVTQPHIVHTVGYPLKLVSICFFYFLRSNCFGHTVQGSHPDSDITRNGSRRQNEAAEEEAAPGLRVTVGKPRTSR